MHPCVANAIIISSGLGSGSSLETAALGLQPLIVCVCRSGLISAGSRRLPGETGTSLLMLQVLGDGVGVFPRAGHQNKAAGWLWAVPHLGIFGCIDQSPKIVNFLFSILGLWQLCWLRRARGYIKSNIFGADKKADVLFQVRFAIPAVLALPAPGSSRSGWAQRGFSYTVHQQTHTGLLLQPLMVTAAGPRE